MKFSGVICSFKGHRWSPYRPTSELFLRRCDRCGQVEEFDVKLHGVSWKPFKPEALGPSK